MKARVLSFHSVSVALYAPY